METEHCEVTNCLTTLQVCHAELRLLRFPDDERLPVWIEKVKGRGSSWTPKEHSRICTRHFDISNFSGRKRSNRMVKGAVPNCGLGIKAIYPVHSPLGSSTASAATLTLGSFCITPVSNRQSFTLSSPLTESNSTEHSKPLGKNDSKGKAIPVSTRQPFKHPSPLTEYNSTKNTKPAGINDSKSKNVAKKKGQIFNSEANNVSAIPNYLNAGEEKEDEYLNKILLRKSVNGLISHVNELVKETTSPVKELELKSLGFILIKIQKNLGLSAEEALVIFQQQVPHNVYISLQSLVTEERSQFKALVRSFSLSLNFYSLPAYNHVRNMVHDALPHPRTISAWYTTIDKYMQ